MERRHDKEVEDSILKNRPHDPCHARLTLFCFELEDEDNEANEGDDICKDIRLMFTCKMVDNRYQQAQPVPYRPTRWTEGR